MICPMCGNEFTDSAVVTCDSCPFKSDCHFICCPWCGYKTVVASPTTDKITKIFSRIMGGKREKS
jgi:hypothetical protein